MTAPEPTRGRFPWGRYGLTLAVIVFLAALPLLSVLFTYGVAEANGCQVNEGQVQPCMVLGHDWGGLLYATGVMGWLMLASLPLGGGAILVWIVVVIIHRLAWGRTGATRP